MILLDAGLSPRKVKQYFSNYGLSLSDIDAILITHDHTDHIKGAGLLAEECGCPVYTTQAVHEGMGRNYCMTRKVPASQKHFIEKEVPFRLGDFTVTPFEVPHDSSDCVGYEIQCEDSVFTLSRTSAM